MVQIAVAGAFSGVLSHLLYFNRGEHHRQAFQYFLALLSLPVVATASQYALGVHLLRAVLQTGCFYTAFLTGLYSSLFVYRAFFHRLNSFPGPFPAKLSSLWHVSQVFRTIDNYKHLGRMHEKYGPIVRVGEYFLLS